MKSSANFIVLVALAATFATSDSVGAFPSVMETGHVVSAFYTGIATPDGTTPRQDGSVLVVNTVHGVLEIRSYDDGVQIMTSGKGGRIVILDPQTKGQVTLHTGPHGVGVQEAMGKGKLTLAADAVTVRRGDRVIATVRRVSARALQAAAAGTKRPVNRTRVVLNPANGHYYERIERPMGWRAARKLCQQLGGHLATVTSPEENRFIYQAFGKDHVCWLGATDEAKEGTWRWVTGEPFAYQNWFRDEPNNEGGAENYLAFGNTASVVTGGTSYYYRFGSRWNDHDEPGMYHRKQIAFPVCEWDRAPAGVETDRRKAVAGVPSGRRLQQPVAQYQRTVPGGVAKRTAVDDPRGVATHEQSAILKVTDGNRSRLPLHTFCLDAVGNILAGVGRASGEIRKLDPDGKRLTTWQVPVIPEAIGVGPDGSVFVGGSGRLVKLDAKGHVQLEKDAPHIRALKDNTDKIRQQVVTQLKRQKEMFSKQIEQYQKRIAKIEEKDDDARTVHEKAMLKTYRRAIERSKTMAARSAQMSDTQIDKAVEGTINRKRRVSSISAAAGDVYLACPATVGYGFEVWRLDETFEDSKRIVTGLRGCCGQMDVQAGPDGVFVAENSRKRVCRYDRDGKLVAHWGKAARTGLIGFGSCCNPMNVAFGPERSVYTAEATTGRIKRYTPAGKLLGLVGKVQLVPGCKNVAIAVSSDGERVYMMDKTRTHIVLLKRREQKRIDAERAGLSTGRQTRRSQGSVRARSSTGVAARADKMADSGIDRAAAQRYDQLPRTSAQEIVRAAVAGDAARVKALLRRNPELLNTSAGNRAYGSTPLGFAAYNGRTTVVRVLLDHGANVDARNNVGVTPLHDAAGQGHKEIVALLLANGADPNVHDRTAQRRTPLQLAVKNGHQDVAALLRQHGATD